METEDAELQKKIDGLKRQKEELDAQKALVDAQRAKRESDRALANSNEAFDRRLADLQNQKALADASKSLVDAQKGLDETAQRVTQLQNQKALADAQKALADSQKALEQTRSNSAQQVTELQNQKTLADAQKALSDAQSQSLISRLLGDVKAGPFSGTVDMKTNAGTIEALLLASRAVKDAAEKIAEAVKGSGKTSIYVFAAKEFPNFQRLLTYRFRKELIKQAFTTANVTRPKHAAGEGRLEFVATPALVSAGLDAFSKLLGFFRTDYTLGGTDAKLDESLLLYAVAGRLKAKSLDVRLPLVYAPSAQTDAVAALAKDLSELLDLRGRANAQLEENNQRIADLQKQVADLARQGPDDQTQAQEKEAIARETSHLKLRIEQLSGVIGLYDAFASSLTTPEAGGTVPLSVLGQEYAVAGALQGGAGVLLLKLENTGGGYLLKKNLLTGLGLMPLFHTGGATVSYLVLSGDTGLVLAADAVAIHGGFVRSDKLQTTLQK